MPKLTCVSCSSTAVQASALQSADDISDALAGAEVVMVVVSPCLSRCWVNKLNNMKPDSDRTMRLCCFQ